MKGDETENKKIGCTVNLMVRVLYFSLFLDLYLMVPCIVLSLKWKRLEKLLCRVNRMSASQN